MKSSMTELSEFFMFSYLCVCARAYSRCLYVQGVMHGLQCFGLNRYQMKSGPVTLNSRHPTAPLFFPPSHFTFTASNSGTRSVFIMAVKWATAVNLLMSPTATSESGFGSLGSFVRVKSGGKGAGVDVILVASWLSVDSVQTMSVFQEFATSAFFFLSSKAVIGQRVSTLTGRSATSWGLVRTRHHPTT